MAKRSIFNRAQAKKELGVGESVFQQLIDAGLITPIMKTGKDRVRAYFSGKELDKYKSNPPPKRDTKKK